MNSFPVPAEHDENTLRTAPRQFYSASTPAIIAAVSLVRYKGR